MQVNLSLSVDALVKKDSLLFVLFSVLLPKPVHDEGSETPNINNHNNVIHVLSSNTVIIITVAPTLIQYDLSLL